MDEGNGRNTLEERFSTIETTRLPYLRRSSSSIEEASSTSLSSAQKWQRFASYLKFNNIQSKRSTRLADADMFYDSDVEDDQKTADCEYYIDRRSTSSPQVPSSPSSSSAYDSIDVHKTQLINQIVTNDEQFAKRYDDSLDLEIISRKTFHGYPFSDFKNNLVECYERYIFCAASSRLVILKDDMFLHCEETQPDITTRQHMMASINPHLPHSINYMKVGKFRGVDSLIICCDNGTSTIYNLEQYLLNPDSLAVTCQVQLSHSVWGVDVLEDCVVFSDNSHRITLFQFIEESVYFVKSTQIIHNITDVKIVSSGDQKIYVGCTSISGELMTFEFTRTRIIGPSDKPLRKSQIINAYHKIDEHVQCQYRFEQKIINRVMLQDQGWSIHQVDAACFKKVYDPNYLGFTKHPLDINEVLQRSRTLKLSENLLVTSNLGGAAKYETLHVSTRFDQSTPTDIFERLNTTHDRIYRVKKDYMGLSKRITELEDKFYIVTTTSRVGLYRSNGLLCNVDTNSLFPFDDLLDEESMFSNRLSIARIIPELSVFIAISQVGIITIFRMVEYRGLYSLREEYSFPFKTDTSLFEEHFYMTIGCGIRKVYDEVYWVYVMNIRGILTKFEIKEKDNDGLSVGFL